MRRPVFLILINFMILMVIFSLLTQSLFVIQRIASPVRVAGRVEVQRGGQGSFVALSTSTPIKTSDVVRTGADGVAEFKWVDGTRWKVMPNTQLSVKKATTNWIRHADTSELKLSAGKVFIRIMKELTPASKFEVETPTAVAAVRGTIFSVAVANGQTLVAVFKGHVQVTSGDSGQGALIAPGQAALSDQPGAVKTTASGEADAAFAEQTTIVQPELEAKVAPLAEGKKALVSGNTEAGDIVTVNENPVKVMNNGHFLKILPLQSGRNQFTVTTTDRHQVKATKVLTLDGK